MRDFRQALLDSEEKRARNLAQQSAVYATGAPIQFSDRTQIARIVERSHASNYGMRSLSHKLV